MNTATMTDSTRDVNAQSVSDSPTGHGGVATAGDPFATQRTADNDPFAEQQQQRQRQESVSVEDGDSPTQGDYPTGIRDRRMSKEWDAAKVPPSRFQKREGSIYATPSSRDGHVGKNKQTAFKEKLKEKGWL